MNAAIRVGGLVKTYPGRPPVEAVRGLDLEVAAGECFGPLGPNGAGKTTTLEIVEGLLDATAGTVEVLGMRWEASAAATHLPLAVTAEGRGGVDARRRQARWRRRHSRLPAACGYAPSALCSLQPHARRTWYSGQRS